MKNQKSPKEVTLEQQLLNLPGEGPKRKVKYFEPVSSNFYIIFPYLHSLLYTEGLFPHTAFPIHSDSLWKCLPTEYMRSERTTWIL